MSYALAARLWRFTQERFPLGPGVLTAVFLAGAGDFVAQASRGGPVLIDGRSAASVLTVLCALFALRVFDEHKDLDADALAFPDRPVQRGLVRLSELFGALAALALVTLAANALLGAVALVGAAVLALVVLLLWRELFVREWLRAHLFVYLATHQAVVPAMLGYAALSRGIDDKTLFPLGLAFLMAAGASVAFEVGRKTRAPEDETPAAETYSRELGPVGAALLSLGALGVCVGAALGLAALLALPALHSLLVVGGGALVAVPFARFAARPSGERARPLLAAGAGVALVTYAPLLVTVALARGVALGGGAP